LCPRENHDSQLSYNFYFNTICRDIEIHLKGEVFALAFSAVCMCMTKYRNEMKLKFATCIYVLCVFRLFIIESIGMAMFELVQKKIKDGTFLFKNHKFCLFKYKNNSRLLLSKFQLAQIKKISRSRGYLTQIEGNRRVAKGGICPLKNSLIS